MMQCYIVTSWVYGNLVYLLYFGNKRHFNLSLSAYSQIISSLFNFHTSSCSVASWILRFKFSCVNLLASLLSIIFILLKTSEYDIWLLIQGKHVLGLQESVGINETYLLWVQDTSLTTDTYSWQMEQLFQYNLSIWYFSINVSIFCFKCSLSVIIVLNPSSWNNDMDAIIFYGPCQ